MPELLFAVAAIGYLAFLLILARAKLGTAEIIICLLLVSLTMDNLILLLGGTALESDTWHRLSWLRYAVHVLVLPLLMQAARLLAIRAGVAWAGKRFVTVGTWGLVAGAVLFGVWTELVGLKLVEAELMDHVRLVSADASPPIATIFTNVIVLIFGAAVWHKSRWPWLFLAALFIFAVNGATATSDYGLLFGNAAELVFALGWLLTLRRFPLMD